MAASETQPAPIQQYQLTSAAYQSPNSAPFVWKQDTGISPSDKTAYLGKLREATAKMQEHINAELTARMEEDKSREAADANGSKKKGVVDEAREEDNYGEELVEEN